MIRLDDIEQVAMMSLQANGFHKPMLIFEFDGKPNLVMLVFDSREAKMAMFAELRKRISASDISSYFFISEGWLTRINKNDLDVKRGESLVIVEVKRVGGSTTIMREFRKTESGEIVWGDRELMDDAATQFTNINFFQGG